MPARSSQPVQSLHEPHSHPPLLASSGAARHATSSRLTSGIRSMLRPLRSGFKADGATIKFPGPILKDGLDAGQQHAALLKLSGSEQALADLLRDSVTAPFILKVHDQKTTDATIRMVDLWFVVRGDLDDLDPVEVARTIQRQGRRGREHAIREPSSHRRRAETARPVIPPEPRFLALVRAPQGPAAGPDRRGGDRRGRRDADRGVAGHRRPHRPSIRFRQDAGEPVVDARPGRSSKARAAVSAGA